MDKLIKKIDHTKDSKKIYFLLCEYLDKGYSLKNIAGMPIAVNCISSNINLIRKLDNYSIDELNVFAKTGAYFLLNNYVSECIKYDEPRAALVTMHYNLNNNINYDLSVIYELYKKYGDKYPELRFYILYSSPQRLLDLYVNDNNYLSDCKSLKDEILIKISDNINPVELYKNLNCIDYRYYVSFLIDTKNIESLYQLYLGINDDDYEKLAIFNYIYSLDTGKYTYKLLTQCHLNSDKRLLLENKLNMASDKQYKYYYMFYKNKKIILESFVSWSAFVLFISSFNDKEEINKICSMLQSELKSEFNYCEDTFKTLSKNVK